MVILIGLPLSIFALCALWYMLRECGVRRTVATLFVFIGAVIIAGMLGSPDDRRHH